MRDFNRNGKVDGHDWHIYDISCRKRMEILKRNDFPSLPQSSSEEHEEHEESEWKTIAILWGFIFVVSNLLSL